MQRLCWLLSEVEVSRVLPCLQILLSAHGAFDLGIRRPSAWGALTRGRGAWPAIWGIVVTVSEEPLRVMGLGAR